VLQLARHWGLNVSERPISIEEVADGCKNNFLKEMFATGTAAVISPVGLICYKGEDFQIADGREDPFGWRFRLA
jgi:branched-chain amino acid aminotransferase